MRERSPTMIYTKEVENMCPVAKGAKHEPAPIPQEGKWVHSKKIEDISGFTHGIGWCAPQQGACKLSLNVKNGIITQIMPGAIRASSCGSGPILSGKRVITIRKNHSGLAISALWRNATRSSRRKMRQNIMRPSFASVKCGEFYFQQR